MVPAETHDLLDLAWCCADIMFSGHEVLCLG